MESGKYPVLLQGGSAVMHCLAAEAPLDSLRYADGHIAKTQCKFRKHLPCQWRKFQDQAGIAEYTVVNTRTEIRNAEREAAYFEVLKLVRRLDPRSYRETSSRINGRYCHTLDEAVRAILKSNEQKLGGQEEIE